MADPLTPTPDLTGDLAATIAQANADNIAVIAAAGNSPGPTEQPGVEPGVLAVGAGDPSNGICSFSATATLYAPGCNLDMADPFTDVYEPLSGDNGTSQASAFTSAVIVALMSYDPKLKASAAEQLLIQNETNGFLNVAAAFQADNLGSIVSQGNANIPTTTTTTTTQSTTSFAPTPIPPPPPTPPRTAPLAAPAVKRWTWHHGVLSITLARMPAGARLHAKLIYRHRHPRTLTGKRLTLRVRTARPTRVLLAITESKTTSPTTTLRT